MLTCTFLELVKGSVINVVIIITGLITAFAVIEIDLFKAPIFEIF